jgi:hypothetical protein
VYVYKSFVLVDMLDREKYPMVSGSSKQGVSCEMEESDILVERSILQSANTRLIQKRIGYHTILFLFLFLFLCSSCSPRSSFVELVAALLPRACAPRVSSYNRNSCVPLFHSPNSSIVPDNTPSHILE